MKSATKERHTAKYTEKDLTDALFEVRENKMPIREAVRRFSIPRSTLQDRVHGRALDKPGKKGPCSILSFEEESKLLNWLITLAKCGFPKRSEDLLTTVQKILNDDGRKTPFKDNKPGKKWYYTFLKRHPSLSIRSPESISKSRAVITEQSIRKWFRDLRDYLKSENAEDILEDPTRILNSDETGFSLAPKTGNVLAPKGYKNVYIVKSANEKETLTVLLTFTACGKTLPPMVIFPYKRSPAWLKVIEASKTDWVFGKTESGWMRSETFLQYMKEGLHTWLLENKIKLPVLFLVDGHKSHMSLELSDFCSSNGIILYALPPNTTHIMQPADVGAFKGLKLDYRNVVSELSRNNPGYTIKKDNFCEVLGRVLQCKERTTIVQNAFRKCGLFPFNPDAVDYTKCVQNTLEMVGQADSECGVVDTISNESFLQAKRVVTFLRDELEARNIDYEIVLDVIAEAQQSQKSNEISSVNTVGLNDVIGIEGTYEVNIVGELVRIPSVSQTRDIVTNQDATLPENEIGEQVSRSVDNISLSRLSFTEQQSLNGDNRDEGILNVEDDDLSYSQTIGIVPSQNASLQENKIGEQASRRVSNNSPSQLSTTEQQSLSPLILDERDEGTLNTTDDLEFQKMCFQIVEEVGEVVDKDTICKASTSTNKSPFEKHLVYPKPLPKSQKKGKDVDKPPMSISSKAWKMFHKNKEDLKLQKAAEIEKRKEDRQMKRAEKKKTSNRKKNVPKCPACDEDVLTDVEDEGMKNIGCDKCDSWFHLKCTPFSTLSFEDAEKEDFICSSCDFC